MLHVDQLTSSIPGLIDHMAGFLTHKRYMYSMVFVDAGSGLGYVHFQYSSSVAYTLEGKTAWEKYARDRGLNVMNYHADNGIFAVQGWKDHCTEQFQGTSFASVNAQH